MKNKKTIIPLSTIIFLLILCIIALCINHLTVVHSIKIENQEAIEYLSENNLSVIMMYFSRIIAYGNGEVKVREGLNFSNYAALKSDATIDGNNIYFFDRNKSVIKKTSIYGTSELEIPLKGIYSPKYFSISPDGTQLAFRCYLDVNFIEVAIMIYNFISNEKSIIYQYSRSSSKLDEVSSISWSHTGKSLFYAKAGDIFKINLSNLQSEIVASGYWVETLPNEEIAYWRNVGEFAVSYKKNLIENKETQMYKTSMPIEGADWDPTGRYLVIAVPSYPKRFFNYSHHVTTPFIWDTEINEQYRLPHCGYYTGCIFWLANNQL
ncbi:hypothetical protein ACFL02_09890 [Planctomycetota bacterium]